MNIADYHDIPFAELDAEFARMFGKPTPANAGAIIPPVYQSC